VTEKVNAADLSSLEYWTGVWGACGARMGEKRNAHRGLIGKHEGKTTWKT